jgi:hypothetical protein
MQQLKARLDVMTEDSPFTDRVPLIPIQMNANTTVVAFGGAAWEATEGVSWSEWLELFSCVAHGFIPTGVYVAPNEAWYVAPASRMEWHRLYAKGDLSIHVSRLPQPAAFGARLMNDERGVVYQYQQESPASGVSVFITTASSTMTFAPTMLGDDDFEQVESFMMTIDDDTIAAMDSCDEEVEELHRAAREREARALMFDRN